MQMRRQVADNFFLLMIPAISLAATGYFVYSGIFGERGLLSLNETKATLAVAKHDFENKRAERLALQHRISLLDARAIDADLLDEVARAVLLENGPNEVAVPREKP
jgi:cell division protein FtsB